MGALENPTGKPAERPKKPNTVTVNKDTLIKGLATVAFLSIILNVYLAARPYTAPPMETIDLTPSTTIAPGATVQAAGAYKIYVINDKRCAGCDVSTLLTSLGKVLPAGQIVNLDYSSSQGKQLYDQGKITLLPAVLMEKGAASEPNYAAQVASYVTAVGDYLSLRIGGSFDPYCDPDASHCSESRCSGRTSCLVETPKTLDLYVMSHCPYGVTALNSMQEVLANIKDIKFSVHYIGSGTKGNFQSLHGATEVTDNILELCAAKYYPDTYMNLIWCRNKDFNADWKTCAVGMDVNRLSSCLTSDEGATLLENDFKIAANLNIGASPSWMANGKFGFNGLDAQTIKAGYCSHNSVAGCEKTLTGSSGAASTAGCTTPT